MRERCLDTVDAKPKLQGCGTPHEHVPGTRVQKKLCTIRTRRETKPDSECPSTNNLSTLSGSGSDKILGPKRFESELPGSVLNSMLNSTMSLPEASPLDHPKLTEGLENPPDQPLHVDGVDCLFRRVKVGPCFFPYLPVAADVSLGNTCEN